MRRLLIPLAVAFVIGPLLALAAPPTDYSTEMVVVSGGQILQTMRLYVSGQKSRVEGMTAGPLGSIVTISRKDKGVVWMLYLDKKQYTEKDVAGSPVRGRLDLSNLNLGNLEKENLGKDSVLGYACTKMRVKLGAMPNGQPMTGTVWIADALDLPIRLEMMGIVQENRNLKAGPQPAALFEIPAGFAKTTAPGMPAGMKPPSAPATPAPTPRYGGQVTWAATGAQPLAWSGGGGTSGQAAWAIVLEADTLRVIRCTSGEVIPRKLAEDGYALEGEFTGDRSLQWHDAAEPGAVLELALPVEKTGRYAVSVRVAKYRTYGTHQFLLNGAPIGKPVDMFGNPGHDIVTAFTAELGTADLVAGENRLGLRLVGTNRDTIMANHGAGIDWVQLQPVAGSGASTVSRD